MLNYQCCLGPSLYGSKRTIHQIEALSLGGSTVNLQPHEVLEHISKTRRLLAECKDEIKLQRQQKELILAGGDPMEDKKRKMRNLSKEIIKNKKWVSTLNLTLAHQRLQLESLTKNDDEDNGGENSDEDVSNESGMSNFSDDN